MDIGFTDGIERLPIFDLRHIARRLRTPRRERPDSTRRSSLRLIALAALASAAFSAAAQDMVVQLPLEEGAGSVAGDVSGNGNDGVLANGAAFATDTPNGSAFALSLDGSNDFLDLGTLDVNGSGLTLATWFKANSFPGSSRDPRLVSKATGTASNQHVFMLGTIAAGAATRLRARVRVGGSTTTLIATSGNLAPGEWAHAALTHDGTSLRLYLNGAAVGSTALAGVVDQDPAVSVAIGAQPAGAGGRYFDGLLDDVLIAQRALSVAEIAMLVGDNAHPQALADGYTTAEDTPLTVVAPGVLSNDTDADGDTLSASLLSGVSNGTLVLAADGSFTYTPHADFYGSDSFTYTATDTGGASTATSVTLTVTSIGDDAPVAADDDYFVPPGDVLNIDAEGGVLWNDTDADGDLTSVDLSSVTTPTSGTLTMNADGSFVYDPAGFTGQASFTYQATDGVANSNAATVTIAISTPPGSDDLLVQLPFEEGAGNVAGDTGGFGNDGSLLGGAAFAADTPNGSAYALALDGTNDFVDLGVLDANGSGLTLAAWFKADSFPGSSRDPRLISKATGTGANEHVFMLGTIKSGAATRLRARLRVAGFTSTLIAATGDLALATWTHAALTHDGTTLRLYLDGVEVGDVALAGPVDQAPAVPIAVGAQPSGAGGKYFDGLLDDVFIAQRALSAAEIGSLISSNERPQALADGYATAEDQALTVAAPGVLSNDSDAAGDTLSAVLSGDVSNGTLVLDANGSFVYTPDADFNGIDSFTYTANDAGGASSAATVTLTVNALDDAPVAAADNYTTQVDQPLTVAAPGVLANDADADGDTLAALLSSDVSNGALALNANGSFTYTPDVDFLGTDSFSYTAHAGGASSSSVTVMLTVDAVNDAPLAVADGYATQEDQTLTVAGPGVLSNDTDAEGDTLTALLASDVSNGTLVLNANGSFVYTPNADYNGSDSFTYTAHDAGGASSAVTVILSVEALNDAPVAAGDDYQTVSGVVLNIGAAGGVLANDSDVDGDVTSVEPSSVSTPSGGTVAMNADGSFTYTPDAGFVGTDTFDYAATDAQASSNIAAVTITVASAGVPGALVQLPFDEGAGAVAGDVSGNANDGTLLGGATFAADSPDGSAFALALDGSNDFVDLGALDVSGSGLTLATWFKADSFPGASRDPRMISKATGVSGNEHVFMLGTIASGSATRLRARVRVGGVTKTLIANAGDLTTGVWSHAALTHDGTTLRLYLDGAVVGSTPLVGAVDQDPAVPVAVGGQPPGAGPRYFDGMLDEVLIAQRPLSAAEIVALATGNQRPQAAADSYTTQEEQALTIAAPGVLANDTDAEGDALSALLVSDVANGTLVLNADGSFAYTPDLDFNGADSFSYTANDGGGDSATVTVTLSVDPLNDAPQAAGDGYQTQLELVLNIGAAGGVLANDGDADGDAISVEPSSVTSPANGSLTMNADGSFSYLPGTGFVGTDTFDYAASDSQAISNTVTVTIDVLEAGNERPQASADGYTTQEDLGLTVAALGVLSNDTDAEGDTLSALLVGEVANGTLVLNANGSFAYMPDADFNGTDSFTYTANDAGGASPVTTVTLTVDAVNDAPAALDVDYAVVQDTTLTVTAPGVLSNDSDADDDPISVEPLSVTTPANGTLTMNANGSFVYTPGIGFVGIDTFDYAATDAQANSNAATVTINVTSSTHGARPEIVSGTRSFSKQVIATDVDQTHAALGGDLDGDGDIDVVATDFVDDSVYWYRNDGAGGFVAHTIDANLNGAYPAHIGDVDLDGDLDVLATGYEGDTIVWYENDGAGNFSRHDVDTSANGAHSVETFDLDGDGDVDLVTTNQDAGSVSWYENDGDNNFGVAHLIDGSAVKAKRATAADLDGDGDLDVISASFEIDQIAWYENDGNENFTFHAIDLTADGAYYVFVADLDGDGFLDVLAASQLDNTIAWHRNDGNGGFTKQVIDASALATRTVTAADVDGDGDEDVIAASVDDDTIAWYENDGNGNFVAHTIDDDAAGAYFVSPIDIDGDGDIDVLSASRDSNEIAIHQQIKEHTISLDLGGTFAIGPGVLLTSDEDDLAQDIVYTLTAAPASGELRLDGVPLAQDGTFTQADVDALAITYVHDGLDLAADGFVFAVTDGGEFGAGPAIGTFAIYVSDPAELVVHYSFDEGSGSAVIDNSVNGNDGTLVGDATRTTDGYLNGAVDFQSGHVDLGNVDVQSNELTLAFWINANSFAVEDARLIAKATGTATQDHWWMISTYGSDHRLRFRLKTATAGVTQTLISSGPVLQSGVWTHVAATYDGAFMRLFQDGVEVGGTAHSGSVAVDAGVAAWIGDTPGSVARPFDGRIDEVLIHKRALSSEQIMALMAAGLDSQPPTSPTGVAAAALSGTRVQVSWVEASDDVAVAGYRVRRAGVVIGTTASAATTFIDENVNSETSYSYDVIAFDAAGHDSPASTPPAMVTTPNGEPPSVPTQVGAAALAETEVNVSWTASSDNFAVAGYRVWRDGAAVGVTGPAAVSFGDSLLSAATTYGYQVTSFDDDGNESIPSSPAAIVTTPDLTPPTAPGNVAGNAISAAAIELAWTSASDNVAVSAYVIRRNGADVHNAGPGSTNYTDTTVAAETTYSYEIVAVDAAGNQTASSPAIVVQTPAIDGQPPSVPANVTAQALSESQILVTWSASSDNVGVSGYRVLRGGGEVAIIGPAATQYTDSGLTAATQYTYTVSALDGSGNESAPSAPASATTPAQAADPTVVATYSFEEGAGSTAVDHSGNGHDGTLTGGATRTSSGRFGDAIDFQSGRVDLGNLDVSGDALTIAMWFNADSFDVEDARLIAKATGVSTAEHWWMISTVDSQHRLRFRLKTSTGSTNTLIANGPSLQAGNWTHVAATYDGAFMRLYQNGVLVGSQAHSGNVATDSSVAARIGDTPGSTAKPFDGRIDEVWIFDRALSETQVVELMTTPSTPDATPPLAPSELIAYSSSTSGIDLHWRGASDNIGVTGYTVLRDGVAVGSTTDRFYVDSDLSAATQYSYSVAAVDAAGNESVPSTPVAVATLDDDLDEWWDASRSYRLPVVVDPLSIRRADKPVQVPLDFTALFSQLGIGGALDVDSIRVVEVNAAGQAIDEEVAFQFDPGAGFDATTNAVGELVLISTGVTPSTALRFYHVYFDVAGTGFTPPAVAAQITLTDNVPDEGLDSYEIVTALGTYYYQKQAGGFSSLHDLQDNDWINHHPSGGSAGNFRGIPNLVFPQGHFHPGSTSASSTIVREGPVMVEIRSVTNDALWASTWQIFPSYARLTVTQAAHDYWFLYEGTPGGSFEPASDYVVRSSGAFTLASDGWVGDLGGEEWAYFGDPVVNRALFVANHEDDVAVDTYFNLDDNMTVFGFGRQGDTPQLSAAPAQFTIGFVENPQFEAAVETISSAYKVLGVEAGAPVQQGTVVQEPSVPQTLVASALAYDRVQLSWDASSDNVGIEEYQVLRDGALVGATRDTTLLDTGLSESTTYSYTVVAIDVQGNISTPSAPVQVTTQENVGPDVTLWYGTQQTFGALGEAQTWINVLGNIADADGVVSASYSLNSQAANPLSIGPDDLRLVDDGDFNIDLGFNELALGVNQIAITATDALGNDVVTNVTVNYPGGAVWPLPYSIDWSAAADIEQVAQVVDGLWALEPGGIRTMQHGYDRLVAIGDIDWTDYEITVPITVHGRNPVCDEVPQTCDGLPPGIGIIARWQGHVAWNATRPRYGWYPLGALGWFRYTGANDLGSFKLVGGDSGSVLASGPTASLPFATTYMFKLRAETVGGQHQYSFKAWPQAGTEPAQWMLVANTVLAELASGSVVLVAHQVDATFGNVDIVPIGSP